MKSRKMSVSLVFIALTLGLLLFIDKTHSCNPNATEIKVDLKITPAEVRVNENFNVTCRGTYGGFLHFKVICNNKLDGSMGLTKLKVYRDEPWYDSDLKADLLYKSNHERNVDCNTCTGDDCIVTSSIYVTPRVSGKYFFICFNENHPDIFSSVKEVTVIDPPIVSSPPSLAPTSTSSILPVTKSSSITRSISSDSCIKETVTIYTPALPTSTISMRPSQSSLSLLPEQVMEASISHGSPHQSQDFSSIVTSNNEVASPSQSSSSTPVSETPTPIATLTTQPSRLFSDSVIGGASSIGFIIIVLVIVIGLLVTMVGCRAARRFRQSTITTGTTETGLNITNHQLADVASV